jgi:hypothetical protein
MDQQYLQMLNSTDMMCGENVLKRGALGTVTVLLLTLCKKM